ncbi:efflux RND transporter periplasmic adaptor subunit [Paraburkholderia caballeronis]|uniref:RND family efflux transporter, MFP subunit n=1 Tax=Paraburkholderia caballeronis TaxID=416943 RepID=A0A1H7K0S9_9BURK|nr:efflux RND transporter periplasmic adaptor subunit [Paraburkholderia caballeronis]PXW27217.1 RND family efflux transporter MFP subunit [Paraburkholderia caballeronis]PXX02691.1 RND family efflux transporter MFP subunit [Paraburkholderia caballeronis]RAK03416.1 RND family efflux transporter MFP subunit [Paraburkholderia caballeronis]SEC42271.1 RND family efflux transporter, MFP subunit [Paraburkholderia caballeronis]SEK79485.1 RND family efflux transporter, MFP subunit [Paraburkholderia caba
MRRFAKYRAAAAIALLVAARSAVAAQPAAQPAPPPAPSAPAASPAPAIPDSGDPRIRIQLVSRDQVDVSSEISAKIASLPFRDGDAFRAGQTLVTLDCSLFNAQLHKAQADADGARDLLDVNRKLQALHSIGELEVQQAQAKQKASAADVAYMQATVRKCAIAAPFDGRVSKRSASPQQFAEPGKPLLTIIDTSHLELKMIVPSKWLAWLKPGHALNVQVDEVGRTYPAKVARIGARVDPVTQTVDVTASLTGSAPELLPGMSGWATFAR